MSTARNKAQRTEEHTVALPTGIFANFFAKRQREVLINKHNQESKVSLYWLTKKK